MDVFGNCCLANHTKELWKIKVGFQEKLPGDQLNLELSEREIQRGGWW